MNDLHALFLSELNRTYDAEQRLLQAWTDMARDIPAGDAKTALGDAKTQSQIDLERLREVFHPFDQSPEPKTCHGIQGIIAEGQLLAAELEGHPTLQLAFMGVAEKCLHFKMSGCGTLAAWAEELGQQPTAELLKRRVTATSSAAARFAQLSRSVQQRESRQANPERERLFVRQLRQMLDGENLLVQALAEAEYYASSRLLKLALHYHRWQTQGHVQRLNQAFLQLGETADRRPCNGLEGIIDDTQVDVMQFLGNSALDAALIANAQKAEHYEIACYENLHRFVLQPQYDSVLTLLEQNLADEKSTDRKLTLLAESLRNPSARRHDSPRRSVQESEFLKVATHRE